MPTVTELRKMMRELAFDPRKPGHLKPVVDVGNIDYYTSRGAEYALQTSALPARHANRVSNLENAITLLSLALWHENQKTKVKE